MNRKFVGDVDGKYKIALRDDDEKPIAYLLWGDPVQVVTTSGALVQVKARGREGWIPKDVLTDESLLEIYVMDVGQGDGVLMRTPDDAWHLIDAGAPNEKQMTRKGAANFVRWKFMADLGEDKVSLKNVIVSHPDVDHYGGLIDLLAGVVERPHRKFNVEVENLYHNGIGRFAKEPVLGRMDRGTVAPLPFDDYGITTEDNFITELLDGKESFSQPARPFEKTFQRFASLVGSVPDNVRRLSSTDVALPGYGGEGPVSIRILGPIAERVTGGAVGLRDLGSPSVTRNGHSIVLRVDYDRVRVLLTGDSNTASQRLLLSYHALQEFAVDVAKGCHHGSDDIDLRFVKAMKARTTVISSGDNEDYAHPRPRVLGASARYGREAKGVKGELLPPLLYSTELARSVGLTEAVAVRIEGDEDSRIEADKAEIMPKEKKARFEPLREMPIATDLIYGLINVRTDGKRVMCGYMKEASDDFDLQIFRAGVEP
jgi:beta-lactamase superfamily II metal-dependent hydrolase